MEIKAQDLTVESKSDPEKLVKKYIKPRIVTYTSEQIIEQVGPALTDSGAYTCPTPIPGQMPGR
jgi:hypothetical protein